MSSIEQIVTKPTKQNLAESNESGYLEVRTQQPLPPPQIITTVSDLHKANIYTAASLNEYKYVISKIDLNDDTLTLKAVEPNLKKKQQQLDESSSAQQLDVESSRYSSGVMNKYDSRNTLLRSTDTQTAVYGPNSIYLARDEVGQASSTKNTVKINADLGCCSSCFSFFGFFCQCFSCFTSFCCKPCCSAAGLIGGIGALGGLLAGVLMLGIVGVIPIPYEVTKAICNATNERNIFMNPNYTHNMTGFFLPPFNHSLTTSIWICI